MENKEKKNPNRMELATKDNQKLWLDFNEFKAQQTWYEKQEKEYWDYHFSGQRTIDMFGVEGAKRVLEIQHREDMKLIFNHRSRGRNS